jgi:hypothetical protein
MPWRCMGEWRYSSPFLILELNGGRCSASLPCHFTFGERAQDTHWIGVWVGPRVGLDAVEKRKILHCWESNPGLPALACHYTVWAIAICLKAETLNQNKHIQQLKIKKKIILICLRYDFGAQEGKDERTMLHGITSQNTVIGLLITVRDSDLL